MQETQARTEENAPTKPTLLNRARKRAAGVRAKRDLSTLRNVHQVLAIGPRAHRRRKTGRTAHFTAWLAEQAVRSHLQKMHTTWLADRLEEKADAKLAAVLRSLADGGYRSVLSIAEASRTDLLAVKGVGRVGLRKLHEYLSKHQVPMSWEV